jgi:hypothetical protein
LAYAQDCGPEGLNKTNVVYLTLRIEGSLDEQAREAVDALLVHQRGRVVWHTSAATGRSYALLEVPALPDVTRIAAAGAKVYQTPIIALAVFPEVREALPALLEALGGSGRPAAVLSCEPCSGGVAIEWDPHRASAAVILGLVDVELRRFNSGRTAELLSPLPPESIARIAADGLEAPQVAPDRVLEMLLDA